MALATLVSPWASEASATVLRRVADGRSPAAIWRREPSPAVTLEAQALARLAAFRERSPVEANAPDRAVEAVLARWGGSGHYPALARELRQLLSTLAALDGPTPRQLRLECIDDEGCSLFHADRVAARLLCTYVGPGTELLPEAAADRRRMGQGDNRHVRDWGAVCAVPTGAVLLMRGDLSPHGPGVLHRSPSNPHRQQRVLVAVDA